jgi:hypothetical protein
VSSFKAAELKVEPEKPDSALDHIESGLFGFAGIARSRAEVSDLPSSGIYRPPWLAIFFDHTRPYMWRCLMVHGRPGRNNATILLKALKDCV